MLANAEVGAGEGDAVFEGRQFLGGLSHEFDPMDETGGVGDLDSEAGTSVEFQK